MLPNFIAIEDLYSQTTVVQQKAIEVKQGGQPPLLLLVRFRRIPSPTKSDLLIVECHKASWRGEGARYPLDGECLDKTEACLPNTLMLSVDMASRSARFGPIGGISVRESWHSFGIGSYLLAQTILWAQREYPDFRVEDGKLGYSQPENLRRRTAFYKNRGFSFKPDGVPEDQATAFYKERISLLLGIWDTGKVTEVSVARLLNENRQLHAELSEMTQKMLRAREQNAVTGREKKRISRILILLIFCCAVLILLPQTGAFLHRLLLR